jgi:hypothetical protein
VWDGSDRPGGIAIRFPAQEEEPSNVSSHFGSGVLTFGTGLLFRTPPSHDLWVKGPANRPKDGIAPLEGIVETDWNPATFTVNWRFTRPDAEVAFERDEPIACLVPYPRGYLERFAPKLRPIEDDPVLHQEFCTWRESRSAFLADLEGMDPTHRANHWQKHYMLGRTQDGARSPGHVTKLRLRPFTRSAGDDS